MDAQTLEHLKNWADWELFEDERDAVIAMIVAFVNENPEFLERCSWPEIRQLAEIDAAAAK